MSDLAAFEPVWDDMRDTHVHLVNTIAAMRLAGLVDPPPAQGFCPGHGADLYRRTLAAVNGQPDRCSHSNAVPVALVLTGEVVARLCPDCDEQLPADERTARNWWPGGMI